MPLPPDEQPIDRRRFFRQGLRELLKPLAQAIEPIERTAQQLGVFEQPPSHQTFKPTPRTVALGVWLRPPGAIKEIDFLNACSRCGVCVNVCPVQCIQIDLSGVVGRGAPYIDPDVKACAVCQSLACMNQCPSGALLPTPLVDIDMGTAVWREETCVRTANGEDCTICADHCPLGTAAIEIRERQVVVKPLGCIGCGVCQQDCPTSPKSILVIPRAAKD